LGATVKPTVPLPLPLVDEVAAIQLTSVVAVQAHSLSVATFTLPVPPAALTFRLAGLIAKRQGARWDTRACSPLTTIIASRDEVPSLGATRNATLAAPCPDAGDMPEIQLAVVDASHAHSG
jgi:hypothetical protein